MSIENIGDLVLYKNNQLIAFNKPAGIPVQADKTTDKSLLDLAEIYCQSKLHLIHRLDRPATGIVLFAKNKRALANLNVQFQERSIKKTYLAVVKNKPQKEADKLIHFLRKDQKKGKTFAYNKELHHTKKAELLYKLIGSSDNYHLLEIDLVTGRFHQIRAQLSAIDSPIKGDVKYGARRSNKDRSIHLHAWKLSFNHPVTNELVDLTANPADEVVWNALAQ